MEQITVAELNNRRAGGATIIDVRSPAEYADAHVEGSENIPLQMVPHAVDRLRAMPNLCLICASGNRSGMACQFLASAGVRAANVVGGVISWHSAGFPLV
ncbi:MAG: hypothetical protein B7X03_01745 [Parcubacteria group bacterium 21-58-10]|nr:MAG: hypothetical protein B7X03_01745 [Parcubacteria group bacterium 21-58-10]